ncbi:MAG: hypothetical protein AB7S86_03510 [Hydrogenophaga sp.]|uniref:hypothetical protein n=1 Tax=Hydrogenophaga sp. TaxID=1904254 RepID=UPI003D10FB01
MAVASPPAKEVQPAATSALLLVAMMIGTLFNLFHPHPGAVALVGVAAVAFLVRERARLPPSIRRVALVLGAVTLLLLPFAAAPGQSLSKGVAIGGLMASIISSVTLMARAALAAPQTGVVARHLLATGMRSRYLLVSLACQLFGGLMGLAGVSMLMDMASKGEVQAEEDRLSMLAAIMRSFAAATMWSPMFSNVTILLALYPGLSWATVVPLCLAMAAASIVLGTLLEMRRLRHRTLSPPVPMARAPLYRALLPMLAAMALFLAAVIALAHALQVAVVAGIVLLIPLAVLVLHALQAQGPKRLAQARQRLHEDYLKLPALAGEVALFMAAGCGGTVIASVIPDAWTTAIGAVLATSPFLACFALIALVIGLAFLAVHPVLTVVLVGTALPPAMVGLPVTVHMSTILVAWGVASYATPFSMIALMAHRYSGYSVTTVTVNLNRGFAVIYLGLATLFLGTIATVLRGHG